MTALGGAIDGVDVVSFDVFDTALLRCVDEPVAVFALCERALAERWPDERFAFADERPRAERAARAHVTATTGRGDVTLDEIYEQLEVPAGLDPREVLALELELERLVSVPNPYILEAYREALRKGRRIAFVSDMYLPAAFIGELLDAAGYVERACLLVSNAEGGESKGSGALYARLAERLDVPPSRMLHVGDNEVSDVEAARRAGLSAVWYERCAAIAQRRARPHPGADVGAAVYRGLVHARLFAARATTVRSWYAIGYAIAGPAWWHYGARDAAIVAALGASPTVLALQRLFHTGSDAHAVDLRAGIADFAADLERLRARLPWLQLGARAATAPLLRLQQAPTVEERRVLGTLLPPDPEALW